MKRLFFLALLLTALGPGLRADVPVVLLAAATDAELQPVLSRLTGVQTERRAAWTFWRGTLAGKEVVLTRTEGDPLNAVAATTLAIRHYAPRLVITFGAARAHDPALRPGDVVVSDRFAAFDGMYSSVTPGAGGINPLKWNPLPHLLMHPDEKEVPAVTFPADAGLLALAQKLHPARGRLLNGVLGSSAQVNREADRIAVLRAQWSTSCEDGESAHVAGCAELLGVPAFGLRVIDGTDGEAAELVRQLVEAMP